MSDFLPFARWLDRFWDEIVIAWQTYKADSRAANKKYVSFFKYAWHIYIQTSYAKNGEENNTAISPQ